jgi:hypothetical protein
MGEDSPSQVLRRRRPVWALPAVIVAVLVVIALFVVGFTGLFDNPVQSTAADGVATIKGTFEPYQCSATACDGYVQAGARSVFVQFPANCPTPAANSTITVTGKPAPDLGSGSYRATACA